MKATKLTIGIFTLLAAMLLVNGCVSTKGVSVKENVTTEEECESDIDCGQDYCSDNKMAIVSPTCTEGKCVNVSTECNETETCVQDSLGVKCISKDTEVEKPKMSCSENSDSYEAAGINTFSATIFDCSDDCPAGYTCNAASCLCDEIYVPLPPAPCPPPVFTNKYFDPPPVDYDFDTLFDMWLDGPGKIEGIDKTTINIPAYDHMKGGKSYYMPFPRFQFDIHPPDETETIMGAYCANDYFIGPMGLDIDLVWLSRPPVEEVYACEWGGVDSFEGVLTVCPETVEDWFDEALGDD